MRGFLSFLFGISKILGLYPLQEDATILLSSSQKNSIQNAVNGTSSLSMVSMPIVEKVLMNYTLSISDVCVTKELSLICYHRMTTRDEYSPISDFDRLRKRVNNDLHFNSFVNCENAAKHGLHLHYDFVDRNNNQTTTLDIPLYTVGVDECRSTGNMIGFYFEAISFAQEEGFAVGRTEFPRKCSDSQKGLLRMLPRVVLPYTPHDNFTKKVCSKMLRYPWESPNAYMYRHADMLGFVNNKMVKSYVEAKSLVISGSQRSIGIHYRCGDNFPIGLFPHDVFLQLLTLPEVLDIATIATPIRVLIHTDAVKGKGEWGDVCWNLLGELSALIALLPQYAEATISIQHSLPAHTYVYLHLSDVIICGTSTFCIMSSFGANLAYVPYGTYLMRLNKPFASNIRLYNATMVQCSNNETAYEEIAKRCKEPIHYELWLEKMRNKTASIVMSSGMR